MLDLPFPVVNQTWNKLILTEKHTIQPVQSKNVAEHESAQSKVNPPKRGQNKKREHV